MREKAAVTLLVLIAGAVVVAPAVISSTNSVGPYGEQAMLAQITQEQHALREVWRPGYNAKLCMHDLADLRQRHVDLLLSQWWL